jgi:hypothetical protein
MARIVIHHLRSRSESDEVTLSYIRKVLREMRFIARLSVSHGPYTTGALAQSITIKGPFLEPGARVHGEVGSPLNYAAAVEGGAERHLIFPNPPRRYMKFYWQKVGRVVYLDKVRHPGQRGKGYLREAARTAGRRYNLKVVIYDV